MEEAAGFFGWPAYYTPFLVRAGRLKPLGKPAPDAWKWFATVELGRLSPDADWLGRAGQIVQRQIRDMNAKQKGRLLEHEPALCS